MKVRTLLQGLLFTAFAFSGAAANASLILTLSDGTHEMSFDDPDGDGMVLVDSAFGDWHLTASGGLANPAIGSEYLDALDLFSMRASGGTGALTITLTQTGMDRSPAKWAAHLGGTTFGSIEFATLLNGVVISRYSAAGPSFSFDDSGQVDQAGPYSMSLVATIHHDSVNDWSGFNYTVTVPEPSTLALLGSGLLLAGWAAMRRRSAARA